ncbi:MAG: bifunctional nuclease family protein [Streptosporangiaceae bacterium]
MAEVEVLGVVTDAAAGEPVLLLRERRGARRYLPIWIGRPEALALAAAEARVVTPRPLTYRLLLEVLDAFDVSLERVRITALTAGQFHAVLDLSVSDAAGTGPVSVSARASDAVALALGRGCGVEVDQAVLDEAALPAVQMSIPERPDTQQAGTVDPVSIEEQVEQLRQVLNQAGPEDFQRPPPDPDEGFPEGPT